MAERADLKSVQYRFESDGGDMNSREYIKLWVSLTREEQSAVLLIKRKQEEQRKIDFYTAKGIRASKKET